MDGPDWRAVLAGDDGVELSDPASADVVDQLSAKLQVVMPSALRALYLTTDGVFDKRNEYSVIWPLDRVVEENSRAWRAAPTARSRLLGFGDDGTGTPFCVSRTGAADVFAWYPIGREAYRIAATVEEFWQGWRSGTIRT